MGVLRPVGIVVLECLKDRAFHIQTVFVKSRGQFVLKGLCGPHKLFGNVLISPLSAHCLKPYFRRCSQGGTPEKVTFGNALCTFNAMESMVPMYTISVFNVCIIISYNIILLYGHKENVLLNSINHRQRSVLKRKLA